MDRLAHLGLRVCACLISGQSALAQDRPPEPTPVTPAPSQLKRFGDWSTTRTQTGDQIVCFALARARGTAQTGATEGNLVYITSWPQAGVKAEVSVRGGEPFRADAQVQLTIGSQTFILKSQGDRAFVGDPIEELKLLDAMKKGGQLTLTGPVASGAAGRDTFSLSGFAAALVHVTQGCP
jgi:invasion protein IalB